MASTKERKTTTPPLHPPYLKMITEAISSLKDRTGSSQVAIAKFLEDKYKTQLPPNFRKMLSVQLKRFAKSDKLSKVKNSYKVQTTKKVSPDANLPKKKPSTEKKNGEKDTKNKKVAVVKKEKERKTTTMKQKMKSLKTVKSPMKRTVKSIKSPNKAPAEKKANK